MSTTTTLHRSTPPLTAVCTPPPSRPKCQLLLSLLVLLIHAALPISTQDSHFYKPGDPIPIWASTVGPVFNTAEQYPYLSLPYCHGGTDHQPDSLSEALLGIDLVNTGIPVLFLRNMTLQAPFCSLPNLTSPQADSFAAAVHRKYRLNLIVDDLPVYGWVGIDLNNRSNLFTHWDFRISYLNDQIIHVNLTSMNPVPITAPLNFTYSVNFVPTNITYSRRFDKYLDTQFFEHHVHWYSILNSFLMCALLIGTVAFVLVRSLRRDLQRYDNMDIFDLDHDFDFDYGWKQIHGDVFRAPPNLALLAALIGNGVQLYIFTTTALLFSLFNSSYQDVSITITASIVIYSLTATLNGYIGTGYYAKYGGGNWLKQSITTSLIVPGTVGSIMLVVNTFAFMYKSSRYISLGTLVVVLLIFLISVVPLTVLGGYFGYRTYLPTSYHTQSLIMMHGISGFPTRVNPIPRPIPERTWHTHPWTLVFSGGVLPFISAYMELYFVLTSAAGLKVYYVYGFALLAASFLALNAACCTILVAYLLINAEDHRWHWVTFNAAGSTALYMFLYATYFYFAHTQMHGMFQSTFYFGYALIGCFFAYLTLGTIGHFSASQFMNYIYTNVKID